MNDQTNGSFSNRLGVRTKSAQRQRYSELFAECVSEEDFKRIVNSIVRYAISGDMVACKIVLERLLGVLPRIAVVADSEVGDPPEVVAAAVSLVETRRMLGDNADRPDETVGEHMFKWKEKYQDAYDQITRARRSEN